MQHSSEHNKAFTIVELMVVVSIIGVMASLLLPAISFARDKASAIACQAHLRQLPMAVYAYAGDWDDCLVPATVKTISGCYWPEALAKYVYKDGNEAAINVKIKGGRNIFWGCPKWLGNIQSNGKASDTSPGYGMNRSPLLPNSVLIADISSGITLAQIDYQSTRMIFADAIDYQIWKPADEMPSVSVQQPGWVRTGGPRHKSGMNVAFFDGHVQKCSIQQAANAFIVPASF